jgi:hypothetical protein
VKVLVSFTHCCVGQVQFAIGGLSASAAIVLFAKCGCWLIDYAAGVEYYVLSSSLQQTHIAATTAEGRSTATYSISGSELPGSATGSPGRTGQIHVWAALDRVVGKFRGAPVVGQVVALGQYRTGDHSCYWSGSAFQKYLLWNARWCH